MLFRQLRPTWAVALVCLCATSAGVLHLDGADNASSHAPSLEDVANAPTTLTVDGIDLTVQLVCYLSQSGVAGPQLNANARRPAPVIKQWATLQVMGTSTHEAPALTPVGVWLSSGSNNGAPILVTSALTITSVSKIEPVAQNTFKKESFVVGMDDAAGHFHLLKVDGWSQPPPLPLP